MALTAKQLNYAKGVLAGMTSSDAFRASSSTKTLNSASIARQAHELSTHPEISAYIARERAKLEGEDLLTRKEAVGILAKIAKGKDRGATHRDKIAAVTQASKMLGYDAPTKTEVKLEGSLLHQIRRGRQ
jgi:phage terminase small subunit